ACEAGLRIDASVHNRPGPVYLITASNLDDIQSKLIGRVGDSSTKSQEQTQTKDYQESAEWTAAISAKLFSQLVNDSPNLTGFLNYKFSQYFGKDSNKVGSLLTTLARPYLRVCAADTSESLRQSVEELKAGKPTTDHTAWWNRPGKMWGLDLRIAEKTLNQAKAKAAKG